MIETNQNAVFSKYAYKPVKIRLNVPVFGGQTFIVSDFWNTLTGISWVLTNTNIPCQRYALRINNISFKENGYTIPFDDNVYYGHVNGVEQLFHSRELEVENERPDCKY